MDNNTDYSKFFNNLTAEVEQETEYGLYVWKLPDGRYVGDGDGHMMAIASRQNDIKKMMRLKSAAKGMGIEEGGLHYLPDKYPVTDSEYDLQVERMDNGLMADPADPGNLTDMDGRGYGQ